MGAAIPSSVWSFFNIFSLNFCINSEMLITPASTTIHQRQTTVLTMSINCLSVSRKAKTVPSTGKVLAIVFWHTCKPFSGVKNRHRSELCSITEQVGHSNQKQTTKFFISTTNSCANNHNTISNAY